MIYKKLNDSFISSFYVNTLKLQEVITLVRDEFNSSGNTDSLRQVRISIENAARKVWVDDNNRKCVAANFLKYFLEDLPEKITVFPLTDIEEVSDEDTSLNDLQKVLMAGPKQFEDEDWRGWLDWVYKEYSVAGYFEMPKAAVLPMSYLLSIICTQVNYIFTHKDLGIDYDDDDEGERNWDNSYIKALQDLPEDKRGPSPYGAVNFVLEEEIKSLIHPELLESTKIFNVQDQGLTFLPAIYDYSLEEVSELKNTGF